MEAEGAGDLTDGLSFLDEPIGEFSLLLVRLFGTSEAHSALFGVGATGSGALPVCNIVEHDSLAVDGGDPLRMPNPMFDSDGEENQTRLMDGRTIRISRCFLFVETFLRACPEEGRQSGLSPATE
jgi:hypothetical protein